MCNIRTQCCFGRVKITSGNSTHNLSYSKKFKIFLIKRIDFYQKLTEPMSTPISVAVCQHDYWERLCEKHVQIYKIIGL